MRTRKFAFALISLAAAASLVWAIYVIQLRQLELEQRVNIIAPAEFIPAGSMLTESMLRWQSIRKSAWHEDMITSMEEAVAMESLVPLGRDEPILRWKLDKFSIFPSREQATFRIPKNYVLSIASGIRAGDRVTVYISGETGQSRRLFPHRIRVASVKSASGAEVGALPSNSFKDFSDTDKERLYASRRADTEMIDHINLNLSEEEWLMIDRLCKDGAMKLVIAFSPPDAEGERA